MQRWTKRWALGFVKFQLFLCLAVAQQNRSAVLTISVPSFSYLGYDAAPAAAVAAVVVVVV